MISKKRYRHQNLKIGAMKGFIAIGTALALMGILLFLESLFLINMSYKYGETVLVVRETEVTTSIDFLETVKQGLHDAVEYSLYKASNDVLSTGGFCKHNALPTDSEYCNEDCLIPHNTPTFQCVPWWRIYTSLYDPSSPEVLEYLTNRTYKRFDDYAKLFEADAQSLDVPSYCPKPEYTQPIEFTSTSMPEATVVIRHPDEQGNDVRIAYDGKFFHIEDNSSFKDTVELTAFSMVEFARDQFIYHDYVAGRFEEAETDMPNNWCKMTDDGYCNVTVDCKGPPYMDSCLAGTSDNCCWGGDGFQNMDCCCTGMYLGDRCEDAPSNCDSELSKHCSYIHNSNCQNFDSTCDGVTSAVEWYNETAKRVFDTTWTEKDVYGAEFTISFSRMPPTDCQKVGYSYEDSHKNEVRVSWTDYGQITPEEIQRRCTKIAKYCTGPKELCTANDPECGDSATGCSGYAEGDSSGTCPFLSRSCPSGCCGQSWSCVDNPPTCVGTNTEASTCTLADGCSNTACCDHTPERNCDECPQRDDWEACTSNCAGLDESACDAASCCSWSDTPCTGDCSCCGADMSGCNMESGCSGSCCEKRFNPGGGDWIGCSVTGGCAICCGTSSGSCSKQSSPGFICDAGCGSTPPYQNRPESCDPKVCGTGITPSGGICSCGCDISITHTMDLTCRANACGNPCWKTTKTVYEDTYCTYDYLGTANLSVEVSDKGQYPIVDKITSLKLPFLVVSGNTNDPDLMCAATRTDDDPVTPTIEFPEWQACKTSI